SVSGWDGGSLPPRYAAAYFAWSHVACTWRTNEYWSGARRAWASVSTSNDLACAWAVALSIHRATFCRVFANSRIASVWVIASSSRERGTVAHHVGSSDPHVARMS